MKKILGVLVFATLFAVSCTKDKHGADDIIPEQRVGSGREDNPNGGGGDNTTSVPAAVLSVFNTRYPNATRIQWKHLSNGNYKAEFFRSSVKWQVIFTRGGQLVKEEHG